MTLKLTLATPEKPLVLDESVESVILPACDGYVQILPQHAEYKALLGTGGVQYEKDNALCIIAIHNGFLEVRDNVVKILADEAEFKENIRTEIFKTALTTAEESLKRAETQEDVEKALSAERKASLWLELVRLGVSSKD